jgi:glucokinase
VTPPWIGIDVGGSAVKLGAATSEGEVLEERSLPVDPAAGAPAILGAAGEAVRALPGGGEPAALGVGLPGLLDRTAGRVLTSPNLPWLEGVDVRGLLAAATGVAPGAIRIENDANVAALGEQWLGAARGERDVLVATLGTGIGGGLVLDGRLYLGEGLAGEIGHVTVDPDGPACGCGSRGCLEALASASAASRRATERGLPAGAPGDLEELARAAREFAGPERALLREVGVDLGHGLGIVLCLLDVRTFVLGGGFSAALDVLEPGIRTGLSEWAYGDRVSGVRIERAALGASAGWIGAARLVAP